jgi:hypothetical protein
MEGIMGKFDHAKNGRIKEDCKTQINAHALVKVKFSLYG